jgi:cadmium resistance protein CadD (predicted permease)
MSPWINSAGLWLGASNVVAVIVLSLYRKRRLDYADVYGALGTFLGSVNIIPPMVLFYISTQGIPAEFRGYELYFGFAAICSFVFTVVGIGSVYVSASRP